MADCARLVRWLRRATRRDHGHDGGLHGLAAEVGLRPAQGVALVVVAGDVVPEKHADGAVAAEAHRDRLGYARADHVAHGGAAEVVKQLPRDARVATGERPRLLKVDHRYTGPVKYVRRQPR